MSRGMGETRMKDGLRAISAQGSAGEVWKIVRWDAIWDIEYS